MEIKGAGRETTRGKSRNELEEGKFGDAGGKDCGKSKKSGREGLQSKTSHGPAAPILVVDVVELGGNPAANARTVTNCVAVGGAGLMERVPWRLFIIRSMGEMFMRPLFVTLDRQLLMCMLCSSRAVSMMGWDTCGQSCNDQQKCPCLAQQTLDRPRAKG